MEIKKLSEHKKIIEKLLESKINEHEESAKIIKSSLPVLEKLTRNVLATPVKLSIRDMDYERGMYTLEVSVPPAEEGIFASFVTNIEVSLVLRERTSREYYDLILEMEYTSRTEEGTFGGTNVMRRRLNHVLSFDGELVGR